MPSGHQADPGGAPRNRWKTAASRCWWLLRSHTFSQLLRRAGSRIDRTLLRWTRGRYRHLLEAPAEPRGAPDLGAFVRGRLADRRKRGALANAGQLAQDFYSFLNTAVKLPGPIDWQLNSHSDLDQLWRFHLHYQEFLLDLLIQSMDANDPASIDRIWVIVKDWVAANGLDAPGAIRDAWHPFCISRRLPVWVLVLCTKSPEPALRDLMCRSITQQTEFLLDHLERDVGGNHLLENARALAVAGAFLDGRRAERWLDACDKILRDELPRQILPHGEHFERSPMYHAFVLEALLDVRDAVAQVRPDLSRLCHSTAQRMCEFLASILHPDGGMPLLGDSTEEDSPFPQELLSRGGYRHESPDSAACGQARTVGDYWTFRDRDSFLLFDAGPVGPDHLPAHAHCDLLTIDASIRGRRFLVDSGVFTYGAGEMRQNCRSTAAHNVLQVDGEDHCDTWSRFRMGRRGWPSSFQQGHSENLCWASASHNAYRHLGVPAVGRSIACTARGEWLIVDWLSGSGRHRVENRLHLHPDVGLFDQSPRGLRCRVGDVSVYIQPLTEGNLQVRSGWYCPAFGRRLPAPVVSWEAAGTAPMLCGWIISLDRPAAPVTVDRDAEGRFHLHWRPRDERAWDWIVGAKDPVVQPNFQPSESLSGSTCP